MNRYKGFTLIELLIVVALILIIAAISVPSIINAKINADEASAVASIRAINGAEVTYQAVYGGLRSRCPTWVALNRAPSRRRPRACSIRAWPAG